MFWRFIPTLLETILFPLFLNKSPADPFECVKVIMQYIYNPFLPYPIVLLAEPALRQFLTSHVRGRRSREPLSRQQPTSSLVEHPAKRVSARVHHGDHVDLVDRVDHRDRVVCHVRAQWRTARNRVARRQEGD